MCVFNESFLYLIQFLKSVFLPPPTLEEQLKKRLEEWELDLYANNPSLICISEKKRREKEEELRREIELEIIFGGD